MILAIAASATASGELAEWVGAISTAAAFIIAAIGYAWSVSRDRKAQARRVYANYAGYDLYPGGVNADARELLPLDAVGYTFEEEMGVQGDRNPDGSMTISIAGPVVRCTYKIVNHSDEVIGPVRLNLVDPKTGELIANVEGTIPYIEPGGEVRYGAVLVDRWRTEVVELHARIIFRDSSGTWWHRYESEPVQRAS
ncbi:MAG: hypothetical protein ACTIA6_09615 [Pseudoclavibacter sp.]